MKMNRFIIALIFIFSTLRLFAQCGNDSVLTKITRRISSSIPGTERTLQVDSFDLTNGIVYSSAASSINVLPGPLQPSSPASFTRNLISYNSNHDTIQFLQVQGNGSGYDSYRKTEFTYDALFNLLSRIEYYWNNIAWTMSRSEIWTYSSNLLTNYLLSDSAGNISQKIYSYTSGQATTLTFQTWQAGTWKNDYQYIFTYAGGTRDSLYYQRWDTSGSWVDSVSVSYDVANNYLAKLNYYNTVSPYNTLHSYFIDTLNNIREYSTYDSTSNVSTYWSYNYFHGHLKIESFGDNLQGSSTNDHYTYDQYGVLLHYVSSGNGTMNYSHDETWDYDSLYRPVYHSTSNSSNVSYSSSETTYSYASANQMSANYMVSAFGYLCQSDTLHILPLISGGCGPYHYSWTPASGLSSDTVSTPVIILTDSISYIVTVSDTTGHSVIDTIIVKPALYGSIQFDTMQCHNCPVALSTNAQSLNYQWYRNDTLIPNSYGTSYTAITSGSYTFRATSTNCTFISDSVVLTIDPFTRINGHVFLDLDSNCNFNSGDRIMQSFGGTPTMIKISNSYYTGYIVADSNGYFDFPIDTGTFVLSLANSSQIYVPSCPDSGHIWVTVQQYADTINGADLIMKPLYNCERLRVSIGANRFRPCFATTIYVSYLNEGSIDVSTASIDVTIPPELTNITSSLPFTVLGNNIYRFGLSSLNIGTNDFFNIQANVACNPAGLTGATFCLDAEISPVNFCSLLPDTMWDGSNVRVFSYCNNNDVCFRILNDSVGAGGHMDSASVWRLYSDNVLVQQGTFQLTSGDDTVLCFPSNGNTFRLEANQLSGFPENNFPFASIERCGSGNYSLGQILHHAPQNILPFYHTYCGEVRNSFDPNAKSVQPVNGTFTSVNQYLNYRIDFQNTGNDTAFKVVVEDETNNQFDYTSVRLTSASHPYTFSIDGSKLVWTFDPIALPDSNVNESMSHGFVEFSIRPRIGYQIGNNISNGAHINFDSNPPVFTTWTSNPTCSDVLPAFNLHVAGMYCALNPITFEAPMQINGTYAIYTWFKNGIQQTSTANMHTFYGLAEGDTIEARLNNIFYCASSDTVWGSIVIHYPVPTITYVAPQLTSSPAATYEWIYNGNLIPGATTQAITPIQTGDYVVRTYDSTGCMAISNTYYFYNTGIIETNNLYSVYPNPADHTISIHGTEPGENVMITDIAGQLLIDTEVESSFQKISVEDILPGVYFVKLKKANTVIIMIIQH